MLPVKAKKKFQFKKLIQNKKFIIAVSFVLLLVSISTAALLGFNPFSRDGEDAEASGVNDLILRSYVQRQPIENYTQTNDRLLTDKFPGTPGLNYFPHTTYERSIRPAEPFTTNFWRNINIDDAIVSGSRLKTFGYYNYLNMIINNGATDISINSINLNSTYSDQLNFSTFNGNNWSELRGQNDMEGNTPFYDTKTQDGIEYRSLIFAVDPLYYDCRISNNYSSPTNPNGYWRNLYVPAAGGGYQRARCAYDTNGKLVFNGSPLYVIADGFSESYSGYMNNRTFIPAVLQPGRYFKVEHLIYVNKNSLTNPDLTLSSTLSATANTDPTPANNSKSFTFKVYTSDMELKMTRQANPTSIGSLQTYDLEIKNNGPTLGIGPVEISTRLNPRLTFQSFVIPNNNWNCTHTSGVISCRYIPGDYPLGLTTNLQIKATINS